MSKFVSLFFGLFVLVALPSIGWADSLELNEDAVKAAIIEEFEEQGTQGELDLELFGGQSSFTIDNAKTAKVMVSQLKKDELQNKFTCQLEIFADGKPFARTSISGKYYVLNEVYVPSKNIAKGETIKAEDLKMIKIRANRVKPSNVTTLEQLVDKDTKRSLKEGKLVLGREVGDVRIIKKGDIVTSVYRTNKMQITAKAEAQENGAKGQTIEAINTKSNKKIYGVVKDATTIEVSIQ